MSLEQEYPKFKLTEVEENAFRVLSAGKRQMNIRKLFSNRTDMDEDLSYVAQCKKAFAEKNNADQIEAKKLADLFEILFAQLVELQDWFGDDVFITETAEFDDYKSGVDAVVEILRDGAFSHLGLAIDVTFSDKQITAKLQRIRDEIDYRELPGIKYFVSQGGDYKGELFNVPRVVVAVTRKDIAELSSLWLDTGFLRKRISAAEPNKLTTDLKTRLRETQTKLARHPLQIEILAQIELQLETFATYAFRTSKMKKFEKFNSMLAIIRNIRVGKREIENDPLTKTSPMTSFHKIDYSLDSLFPYPAIEN